MSCNEIQNLDAYADGDLPADERARVEQHLAICAACARELARLRKLSAIIGAYRPVLSSDALERIHNAVGQTWDVGILRIGEIVKRPVVVEVDGQDSIAIHPVMFAALSYDHRIVDGVAANIFLYRVTELLETGAFEL